MNYRRIFPLLMAGLSAALHATTLAAGDLSAIHNYHAVSPTLATAGTLEDADIGTLASNGFEVIIDLREIDESDAEAGLVERAGMTYVNVPVSSKQPEQEMLDNFLIAMREHGDRKILVHCRSNRRAAAMTYLFRVIEQGADPQLAMEDVRVIAEPSPTWQAFIDAALAASDN